MRQLHAAVIIGTKHLYTSFVRPYHQARPAFFLFIIVGVLLCTSAAQGAVEKPEQKMWRALYALGEARSFAYDGAFSMTGKMEGKYAPYLGQATVGQKKNSATYGTVTVNFKGAKEIFTPREYQSWLSFLVTYAAKEKVSVGMETRSVGGKTYIAITDSANMPLPGLDAYKNMWVQLDFKSVLQEAGPAALLEKQASWLERGKNEEKIAKDLLLTSNLLKVKKVTVKKSGSLLYDVYTVTLEKPALKKFISQMATVLDSKPFTAKEMLQLDEQLAEIKSMTGEIWVSKKDGYLARIRFDFIGRQQGEKSTLQVMFKNINQPITVLEPASYVTLKELFGKLFPGAVSLLEKQYSAL